MKEKFITDEDEYMLFHGFTVFGKTDKQYGRFLLLFMVLSVFWILVITNIKRFLAENFFLLLIVVPFLIFMTVLMFYGLINNMFLKYRNKGSEYFITNKRVALNSRKKGLKTGSISEIYSIGISNEKNNYGDLGFVFYGYSIAEVCKTGFTIEGIYNPRKIAEAIYEINDSISITDDVPQFYI